MPRLLVFTSLALLFPLSSAACGGAAQPSGPGPTVLVGPAVTASGSASAEAVVDDYKCNGTPFKAGDHDYCAYTTPRSWQSARQVCRAAGGDLASFDGPDEAHDVFMAVGPPIGAAEAVWFGLTEPQPGRWTWIDGTSLGAAHWNQGEPNNDGGNEHCAEWKLGPGSWNDAPCTSLRPYVCGQPLSTDPGKSPMKCSGQPVHTAEGDYCFHLGHRKSWADAKALCESEGTALAILSTSKQDSALHEAVGPKLPVTSLWIGFSDAREEDEWMWVSGEPARSPRWKYGEPNDFQQNEDCAEWYPDDGQMNDLDCKSKRPFLCEHTVAPPEKTGPSRAQGTPHYKIRGPE